MKRRGPLFIVGGKEHSQTEGGLVNTREEGKVRSIKDW